MARVIEIADNRDGYRSIVEYVRMHGRQQESRNGLTLEVDDLVIELIDPTKAIPCGINREGYSLALGLLEGLQLIAGETYDDLMVRVAPNTEQFRENDGAFHGAYGRRIGDQMPIIIERLKKDPDTRQAVVTVWDPKLDAAGGKRDHPCTTQFNWRVRDGKLVTTVIMRSSDLHWGLPYDLVMFCTLHLAIADYLQVLPGSLVLHAASSHLYIKDLPTLSALKLWDGTDLRLPSFHTRGAHTWVEVQIQARNSLEGLSQEETIQGHQSNSWYYSAIVAKLKK